MHLCIHCIQPSITEKAAIRPQLGELAKLRKQLKQMYSQDNESALQQTSSEQLLSQTAPAEIALSGT